MSAVLASLQHIQQWFGGGGSTLPRHAAAYPRPEILGDRNEAALASYLLAVLSPLPLLGLLFGLPALYLGVKGLRFARRNPRAGGEIQSWIGIALGGVFSLLYLAVAGFLLAVLGVS